MSFDLTVATGTSPVFGEHHALTNLPGAEGEIMFSAKEVALACGYVKPSQALKSHVDPEDVYKVDRSTYKDALPFLWEGRGNGADRNLITEAGFYSLVLSSKLRTAKAFKRWVVKEILPSIRANGGYVYGQERLTQEEFEETMSKLKLLSEQVTTLNAEKQLLIENLSETEAKRKNNARLHKKAVAKRKDAEEKTRKAKAEAVAWRNNYVIISDDLREQEAILERVQNDLSVYANNNKYLKQKVAQMEAVMAGEIVEPVVKPQTRTVRIDRNGFVC